MKLGLLLILTLGLASAQQQPESRPGTYAKKIETSNEEVRGHPNMTSHIFDFLSRRTSTLCCLRRLNIQLVKLNGG